jgi:hypothetical protein
MGPSKKYFSHPSFSYQRFSNFTHKLKLGRQVGGRLLIATHLEESNYLPNQKQAAVNKYDFTVFITLVQGSETGGMFERSQWIHWVGLTRFPVQVHILSVGGDALTIVAGTS